LVVFGRHSPQMEFVTLLLSDEPALDPPLAFFHRLLADDQEEATTIAEKYLKVHSLEATYAKIFISALALLEKEREQGKLTGDEQRHFVQATQEILHDVVFPQQQARWAEQASEQTS